jgi:hypothetical protein
MLYAYKPDILWETMTYYLQQMTDLDGRVTMRNKVKRVVKRVSLYGISKLLLLFNERSLIEPT